MSAVKTAISVDANLFKQSERLRRKMRVSRSRLVSMGLEYLVRRQNDEEIRARLNEAYKDQPTAPEMAFLRAAARKALLSPENKW
jgi:hypothetical protein